MDDKYRSRKWILALLVQGTATLALFTGFIDAAAFSTISATTMASYAFANSAEFLKKG